MRLLSDLAIRCAFVAARFVSDLNWALGCARCGITRLPRRIREIANSYANWLREGLSAMRDPERCVGSSCRAVD